MRGYYDYRGITHVHSIASTGGGTYPEILSQAQSAGLEFVVLTEVNQPQRPFFAEGYFHDILVLAGGEYSYFDSRLMYYGGTADSPPTGQSQTQVFFADLLSQQNKKEEFIVLAHPFYSRYSWRGEYPNGLNGIEILNLKSIFASSWEKNKFRTVLSFLTYPFNAQIAFSYLLGIPNDELLLWDKLNKNSKTIGFAGNDSTSRLNISGDRFIKFPSYESTFGLISNHLLIQSELTGNFEKDKIKVLRALKNGNFYISVDLLGATEGFVAEMSSDSKNYLLGSDVPLKKNTKLSIELPGLFRRPYQVRIIKDGEDYSTSTAQKTVLNINAPGIYRVEVYVNPKIPLPDGNKWLPWIYSNSFYVHE